MDNVGITLNLTEKPIPYLLMCEEHYAKYHKDRVAGQGVKCPLSNGVPMGNLRPWTLDFSGNFILYLQGIGGCGV